MATLVKYQHSFYSRALGLVYISTDCTEIKYSPHRTKIIKQQDWLGLQQTLTERTPNQAASRPDCFHRSKTVVLHSLHYGVDLDLRKRNN